MWDPMRDEGDPNSLWRAAPWAPSDDYHGVGGNTQLPVPELHIHWHELH